MSRTQQPSSVGFDAAKLIETHQAGIWRYLRALGCDAAEADDVTQETFLKILERPFDHHNDAATAGYLRKVAFSRFVSMKRRHGRFVNVEQIEEIDERWNQWVSEDQGEQLLEALKECLSTLTDRARQALEMRFRDRESRANIALALEITEHGAKNLMQRAKKQLRACVQGKLR